MRSLLKTLNRHEVIFIRRIENFCYPYTDYTNYTDYTPYTRYTANPGKTTGIEIPAWLIRKVYKRTRPIMQAQPCIPAEYGG